MTNPTGWKKEPLSFSNVSHERLYGSPPRKVDFKPFDRDISGIPVIYQGASWSCVAATVAWIKQFLDRERTGKATALSFEYLAVASNTGADGATPSQVLYAADDEHSGICESEKWIQANKNISVELEMNGKQHGIAGYAYLESLTPEAIYSAMSRGPIMVGVDSYQGSEAHMMGAWQHEERNGVKGTKTVNWWDENKQGEGWVPYSDIKFAASILTEKPDRKATMPKLVVLASKWSFVSGMKKVVLGFLAVLGSLGSLVASNLPTPPVVLPDPPSVQNFGSAGIYDVYSPAVSESGVNSTDLYLPVTTFSLTDGSGISITTSTIRLPVYLVVNPRGTNRETFECNSLSTSQPRFTTCYRAISCNNLTNSTSTIAGGAFAHQAGEPVIMSNSACFFNRFVDTFTTQTDIQGVKHFTATSVEIGDNTTSTEKKLIFRAGLGEGIYLGAYGPLVAGATTGTVVLNLGAGEFNLNASGTTVGVQSNGGLNLANGLLGISTSPTQGVATDTLNTLIVRVSSTDSDNGGFLNFVTSTNGLGRIFWDIRSFLAKSLTWLGNHIFQGNVTVTGNLTVNTPTTTTDAVNKGYADSNVSFNTATGTAGVPVSAGNALYISTTGTLFLTDADATSTSFSFVGIAEEATTTGGTVKFVKPGGIAIVSGLTSGTQYYLSGTPGGVQAGPGGTPVRIGVALSANRLEVMTPSFRARSGGTGTGFNGTEADAISTGWIPTRVELQCGIGQDSQSIGTWALNNDGTSTTKALGTDDDSVPYWKTAGLGRICFWEEGITDFIATITTSTGGFTINSVGGAPRTYQWTAEYDMDILGR